MKLYELATADRGISPSPYVWRIKMLLAHLGVEYESEMLLYTELKEGLAFAQPEAERLRTKEPLFPDGTVPVLVDGDTVLPDSWTIASYLDEQHGDGSLANAKSAMAMNRFFHTWALDHVPPVVSPEIFVDCMNALDEVDRATYRRNRETQFGIDFDDLNGIQDCDAAMLESVRTLEQTLAGQEYLGGDSPGYADYIVFGWFVWLANTSSAQVLTPGSAVFRWRERLMDAYDGLARG